MQRQLDFSPAKRYHQFEQWQEKILQIGRELVERGEFLRSRRIKLSEEHTEILAEIDRHLRVHPHHRSEIGDKILYECMDFVNIAGIMCAMVHEPIPLDIMLQRLLVHHPLYRTEPKVRYTFRKEYSREQLLRMWEVETENINLESHYLMKEGRYILREKLDDSTRNWRRDFFTLMDEHMLYLPDSWDGTQNLENSNIADPAFYLKTSLADSINYPPLISGLLGYDTHLPFSTMYNKLLERDERYNTGFHRSS